MLGLSALTWFVIIVAGYALLLLILPREYMWIPFVAVVVAMTVLAYHIVPDETDDLYRYYGMLDIMREQGKAGLDYIVNLNWYNWKTYITFRYYFYFLSFFPNNRYVAAVTMFIVYALMFLVMYKAAQRYQVSKGYVLLGTLFFLSTYWFYDTASGIRNGLAFAHCDRLRLLSFGRKAQYHPVPVWLCGGVSAPFLTDFAGGVGVVDLIDHEV